MNPSNHRRALAALATCALLAAGLAQAADQPLPARPNILMIMTDDVGYWNVGAYSHGMMAPTPNIDRLAREGMLFTDHYAEPTCTAGRAAFITGQMPIRTGLTTVGLPGSPQGLDKRDPTLAEVLKARGYTTAQFGKNHLGDRDEHMPHRHGFDEFFGNLYHLNTEEEPEQLDYPKDPAFRAKYGPRGVIEGYADGRQRDMGPLTAKRMETFDDEVTDRTVDFLRRNARSGQPFFVWYNTTRMHNYTHLKPASRHLAAGISSEEDIYGSGMMELDGLVGRLLDELDKLGIAKNTIVLFTSDNGAQAFTWPDGGTTPFRGEKSSTWEGGYRVPMLVRWPGVIRPGTVSNGIQSHLDLFTTLASAGGAKDVGAQLQKSHHVKIDGVDNLAHWAGQGESQRKTFIYYNEREPVAVRVGPWKGLFQERNGFFDPLKRSYAFFNLRMDPFEQRDGRDSNRLALKKSWIGGSIQDVMTEHLISLRQFPPRQAGGSLRPDERAAAGSNAEPPQPAAK